MSFNQFIMRATFHYLSFIQYDNLICITYCGKAVSHYNYRFALVKFDKIFSNCTLIIRI